MNDSPKQNIFGRHALLLRKHSFKLLSIGLSFMALITAFVIHGNAEQTLAISKALLQQQQATNSEADQASALLDQYLTPYRVLQERGVIAVPDRLQWLETLQLGVNENLLPKLSFVLSPTAPASNTNTIYTHDTLGIKVTPMRVEFTVLHEGDLLRFLNDMHTQSKGVFSVQTCELTRSEDSSASEGPSQSYLQINFKGSCEFLWYTVSDITSAWESNNEFQ